MGNVRDPEPYRLRNNRHHSQKEPFILWLFIFVCNPFFGNSQNGKMKTRENPRVLHIIHRVFHNAFLKDLHERK